jgi:cyclopropane-fatty-acyl-phospholipid synthase
LDPLLKRFVTVGRLEVEWPGGRNDVYGGTRPGPDARVRIRNWRTLWRLLVNPALTVGECYMDGGLEPVDSTIYEVLDVLMANRAAGGEQMRWLAWHERLGTWTRRIAQFNPAARAQRNVAHHYDLNGRLYSLFLDRDRQYSCAYFPTGKETLEEAQIAKKRHIAAKLRLDRPDLEVLDIGCGWGGMALTLARDYGCRVLGITLSKEQLAEARARADAAGLADRVRFELLDYRALDRKFDRIVSVGMFEHVGIGFYDTFFKTLARSLKPDGVALLHTIGRSGPPGATNAWIAKYVFPGGYCPPLSEVMPAAEKSGLVTTDVEILRLHYAETLRHWRRRFSASRDAIASLYDERFCRMFEFYLAGSELSFRREGMVVFQLQLTHDQLAVPLTRDYITHADQEIAQRQTAAA